MKILIFLNTLFLMTECFKFDELRHKQKITWNQIQYIMEISQNEKIFNVINEGLNKKGSTYNVGITGTKSDKLSLVKQNLDSVRSRFMDRTFGYILKQMYYYYTFAILLINDKAYGISDEQIIRIIKLHSNQQYCIFTFLHDYGKYDVENALETMMYLKLFTETNLELIQTNLKRLVNNIESYKLEENIRHPMYGEVQDFNGSIRDLEVGYDELLHNIKEDIYLSSNLFCDVTGSQLISDDMFSKTNFKTDNFMHYVFVSEECNVKFVNANSDSELHSEKHHIESWDCSSILGSEEYGYKVQTNNRRSEDLLKIFFSLNTMATTNDKVNWTWPNEVTDTSKNSYNLATLQNKLKTHYNFQSIVQYENIAADVILYVALKEGIKVLKAIKLYIKYCISDNENLIFNSQLITNRTLLLTFKYHFDALIDTILRKRRINLKKNASLIEFKEIVTYLLKLMDPLFIKVGTENDEDRKVESFLDKIGTIDENVSIASEIDGFGNLREFYMINPILNIRRLNHFVSYECNSTHK